MWFTFAVASSVSLVKQTNTFSLYFTKVTAQTRPPPNFFIYSLIYLPRRTHPIKTTCCRYMLMPVLVKARRQYYETEDDPKVGIG